VSATGRQRRATPVSSPTVFGANDRPEVNASLVDQSIDEDQSGWSYTIDDGTFSDADIDDVLTFNAALANGDTLPDWISFDADTLTFSGTPPKDYHGSDEIVVTASDGTEEVTTEFTLTVNAEENQDDLPMSEQLFETNLIGTKQNDKLQGTDEDDVLRGRKGDDTLNGRGGDDVLMGGRGHDTFVFSDNSDQDTIRCFNQSFDFIDAKGALNINSHEEVFAFFDTNDDGLVDGSDGHSHLDERDLILEFDDDFIDGNADHNVRIAFTQSLTIDNFGNYDLI
ncbi:MAG: hypothetical protein GY761_04930, partial [Hyphomicrobiales bacterium]|nr:hypothetical protein [Hyphomicrobiales bacterium]